jgi:predicted TIM-barrel fold metal-dependent hydrolase
MTMQIVADNAAPRSIHIARARHRAFECPDCAAPRPLVCAAAQESLRGRIFCGEPVSTPDRVRGRLFPENAPAPAAPARRKAPKALASSAGALADTASKPHRIDVHHHIVPPRYVSDMGLEWVNRHNDPLPLHGPLEWTPERSIAEMDRNGVATAITSLSDPGVWSGDVAKSRGVARYCNEYAAELVRDHPGRFGVFASLALPDIEGSLREIEYAFDVLHADGIVLMTSYGDRWPGDPAFAPVFDELNRRKAVVYFHPTAAPCCEGLIPDVADAVVEFLFDTVRAVTSLLYSGTFTRCGDIRWIFSHAGSAVPLLAARIARLARITPAVQPRLPDGAMHELQKLYFDVAQQASPEGLAPLMMLVSARQVLFGSDYPWAPPGMMGQTVAGLAAYGFSPEDLHAIERGNALRLFPRFARP